MTFLMQRLIYTINIWFKFVFGSFFEQDYLLNLIILGVMRKDDLNMLVFQNRNWYSSKSDRWLFFLILTVSGPFHRKDFKWKKILGYGINFWKKWKFSKQNLPKEWKQPPVVICNWRVFTRAVILMKNYLWLLPFFMAVATYYYYNCALYRTSLKAIWSC